MRPGKKMRWLRKSWPFLLAILGILGFLAWYIIREQIRADDCRDRGYTWVDRRGGGVCVTGYAP